MARRQAREKALQILFEIDIKKETDIQLIVRERFEDDNVTKKQQQFIEEIVAGTHANLQAIDEMLVKVLEGWNIERIGKVERNILRLATYEMFFTDIADSIAINEAVELAKVFSTGQSASFINGILAKLIKTKDPAETANVTESIDESDNTDEPDNIDDEDSVNGGTRD
ncbi:transcription antitermination factor NusB [Desulfuribacillus alkaliarsenatis]|uniref:Transcription antitermination protein NusB n=1 Tax=Desulfuribacillus alkaliarsenatis TaxID=766136 RepID=A0A1E5G5H8_9FIRM|nr:transcription antitermination factor NusB [Desulfuribacillus alkaliarsenatis]OEF98442.1 transcription antitermination factor NusB [Desulfuribacillus alkaliarsenatis]